MASRQSTVDYIVEQCTSTDSVSARKMFGEYAIYCGEKTVALVCDDQLFVKPTAEGRAFLGACPEGPPYPGAKPWLIISGEKWDDRAWLSELVRITATHLPIPRKKPPKKSG